MAKNQRFELDDSGLIPYSPVVLVRAVLKRWLLVLAVVVVTGVVSYICLEGSYTPVYQANATLVVSSQNNATVYTSLQSASSLANVFSGLLNSSTMQKVVLADTGVSSAGCTIAAKVIAETNLLTIQVTGQDPRTVFLVIRSLIENHDAVTYGVVGDVVIEVLQAPQMPTAPMNTSNVMEQVQKLMLLAGAAACAALAVLAFLRDCVRSRKEAEKKLDCWCLGEVRHEKKYRTLTQLIRRRKLALTITNPHVSFRFVETIRKLRRRVEQRMAGRKVVLVTSVLENEGKSTIAVNLALSMAKKHRRVLLIDLDLRKPACCKILEQKDFPGTTRDVLEGRMTLEQAVTKDPLSGLELLLERSGKKGTELLNGDGLTRLLELARQSYDYVVLDLPPMGAAADAELVAGKADAALLVIQQEAASTQALENAVSALRRDCPRFLGCVVNNVYETVTGASGGYGYGYGYGYGKYGKYGGYGKYGNYGRGDGSAGK